MSEQGFRNVPGVPEGWELVLFGKPKPGDFVLNWVGQVEQWNHARFQNTAYVFPIIRKIEQPARYRPFSNGKEAHPFWDVALRLANAVLESKHSRFRITTIGVDGITTNATFYTYEQAFERFCVDDDGTPFGVKIDES
jgi:hypothetical protein